MNATELPSEGNLHAKICTILRLEWDPIGIGNSPEAIHEYDGYAKSLLEMLLQRRTRNELATYLWWAETENMGLDGDRQLTDQISARLEGLISRV